MRILSYIVILLIIILGVTFASLNSEVVTIRYYLGQRSVPLSLLLILVFAVGCILGLLVAGWAILKSKMKARNLNKRLQLAEKEVENLRAIPLQDKH